MFIFVAVTLRWVITQELLPGISNITQTVAYIYISYKYRRWAKKLLSHTSLLNCFLNSDRQQLSQGCQFIYLHFYTIVSYHDLQVTYNQMHKNKEKNWDDCIANWEWKKPSTFLSIIFYYILATRFYFHLIHQQWYLPTQSHLIWNIKMAEWLWPFIYHIDLLKKI